MITRVLPLLVLASYSLIQGTVCVCPSEEFIQPCSCTTVAFGNHVVCDMINSTDVLTDIFRVLSNYEIHTLLLNSLRLSHPLSRNTFKGIKVNNLRFEDSMFVLSNESPPFEGLEDYLTVLDISNCHVEHLAHVSFSHLRLLREVTMNFDTMVTVTTNWFKEGPENIKLIRLDHNQIETISHNAFRGLRNVETVSLADNKLEHICRNIFPRPANKLNWLDISYNKLDLLPIDLFTDMPHLKRVVLTGNRLQSLPINTWGKIWGQLEQLILKDNPLVCDNDIKWAIQQQRPFILNGSCKAPKELTGIHLDGLTEDHLQTT